MVAMAWRSAIRLKRRAARWLCWVPRPATVWPERVVMALKAAPLGAPEAGAEPDGEAAAAAEAAVTATRVPAAATMMSLFCFRLMIRWRDKVTFRSIARAAEGARSAMSFARGCPRRGLCDGVMAGGRGAGQGTGPHSAAVVARAER
jgi:hypothetical protein